MSNTFGKLFSVTTFGESHGLAIGAVIDGCPAGLSLSPKDIQHELDRRSPGKNAYTSPRKESDKIQILSGVFEGKTTGAPIGLFIYNKDSRPSDYKDLKDLFRPGHADFTFQQKFGHRDFRGGGRSSGRETAMRVAAGAIAKKILSHFKITIAAQVVQIGSKTGRGMEREIKTAMACQDSVGGIVEVVAKGVPAGLGEPIFDKLDADLGKAILSIGAVKGVEIGDGFSSAFMRGSEHNDAMRMKGGKAIFVTNHAGGILGGISNGNDIVLRAAIKPTSSIEKEQNTVSVQGKNKTIKVTGRHDPCICIRIVPVIEAMTAITLADHLLRFRSSKL